MSLLDRFTDATIIVLDDDPSLVHLLLTILADSGYANVRGTSDPREAIKLFAFEQPDLLLLDLRMPGMDGLAVLSELPRLRDPQDYVPVLVLTGDDRPTTKSRALELGATDFVQKPFERVELELRIKNLLETRRLHLELRERNKRLESRVSERTRALEDAQFEMLRRLARAAEHRDDATGEHTRRVGAISARVAAELGLDQTLVDSIAVAAPLHDVGKIAVPDLILLKPAYLTMDEREVMRGHTLTGADLLAGASFSMMDVARQIALHHHERWDGNGYPHGLRGDAIPLPARIVCVVDALDAMTHDRPYRRAWSTDHALIEIERCSGTQFDPTVVESLQRLVRRGVLAHV